MNDLQVFSRNGRLYTDSREVAEMVGKRHDHLVRDIDGYISVLHQNPKLGADEFFSKSSYRAGTGKSYPCYLITKKGCEFVANKLTGEKGVIFTAAYVNAFHNMEDVLAGKRILHSHPKKSLPLSSFNHMLEINIRQMKAAAQPATQIAVWTNGMTRDVLKPYGIDVPVLPEPVQRTYDATEIATKLGVYSKSGNPHARAVTAVIKSIGISPEESFTTETTAHAGTKNVPDVRYTESVLKKVKAWLDCHKNPSPIVLGQSYKVIYQ